MGLVKLKNCVNLKIETTGTLCRGNFPEILTIAGFKSTIDIVGG